MDPRKTIYENLIETLCLFGIIIGISLSIMTNYLFLILSIVSLFLLLAWKKYRKNKIFQLYQEFLKNQWGNSHLEDRDFFHVRKLYDLNKKNTPNEFFIDDISWRDLNMDSIVGKVDHSKSFPGLQKIYDILRRPLFNQDILIERNELVNSLGKEKDLALAIQYPLSLLGKSQSEEIFTYFENGMEIKQNPLLIYRILSSLFYLSLGLFFLNKKIAFLALISILSINAWIYQANKYKIEAEIEVFRYIANLLKCADAISKFDRRDLNFDFEGIKKILKSTRKIYKNVSLLNTNASSQNEIQFIMDYINMLTLREAIIFYKTVRLLNEHKKDLLDLYCLIGEIDAYISLASYKDSLDYFTEPSYRSDNNSFSLSVEGLYHPLLEEPVPYSFSFDNKGALITGSNASGKSTFLRTIGVNALFGQTFYFVLARSYQSNYFKILSSIGTVDSIEDGESYFMVEAKSLKRIIDELDGEEYVLCILDEIFRGTNTAERISAASEALKYMAGKKACVLAATHDLELTTMIEDKYNNYHFREEIKEEDIIFNYILYEGPTTSRNAIAILKYLGYPEEIYGKASSKVDEYLN